MSLRLDMFLTRMSKNKMKLKSKNFEVFTPSVFGNLHIWGPEGTGIARVCVTAVIIGTKVRTGRKTGGERGSQEGVRAQIRFHPLPLFIEL